MSPMADLVQVDDPERFVRLYMLTIRAKSTPTFDYYKQDIEWSIQIVNYVENWL